jgi:hypothetical protein
MTSFAVAARQTTNRFQREFSSKVAIATQEFFSASKHPRQKTNLFKQFTLLPFPRQNQKKDKPHELSFLIAEMKKPYLFFLKKRSSSVKRPMLIVSPSTRG